MHHERHDGGILVTTDPTRLDLDAIHDVLAGSSYWATGIPREVMERSIRHSICFGAFDGGRQVGFARVVTDRATFAYLADVFVIEEQRGRGLAAWLTATVLAHPELQGLRRWLLVTRDAHGLYRKLGFTAVADPSMLLTRHDPDIYTR